ncbi:Glycosyltransferase family 2 protein [uncultured Gammaproteobacteria bacterium]
MTDPSAAPMVSIVTPTYGRESLLRAVLRSVVRQTLTDFEWLILDDSPQPSAFFLAVDDRRIRYFHHPGPRLSIGAKRNWLIENARAEIIAQFDDDDYYAPDYLATMTGWLERGADLVKLSGWFVYSRAYRALGYWDLNLKHGLHFIWSAQPMAAAVFGEAEAEALATNHLGFGFSYLFRKSVWRQARFPDQNFDEDGGFIRAALAAGCHLHHFADTSGLCLHILHQGNTSRCFPQYLLPSFMFDRYFPPEARALLIA